MIPASPTQTVSLGTMPQTPHSEPSRCLWPSRHSKMPMSPVIASEGKARYWGTIRVRGTSGDYLGVQPNEHDSPSKPQRRKSIADLFGNLSPPKKDRGNMGRTRNTGSSSRTPSPEKKHRRETSVSPLKRRKSISSLFGLLRGSSIRSPDRADCSHSGRKTSCDDNISETRTSITAAQEGTESSTRPELSPQHVSQACPTLRVRFADSDRFEDPFRDHLCSGETIISVREIQTPDSCMNTTRICSVTSATLSVGTSNAPTLIADTQDASIPESKVADRAATPDSYLRFLVEEYESRPSATGSTQAQRSPTPSPTKCLAVQPLDFLADRYTPPLYKGERDHVTDAESDAGGQACGSRAEDGTVHDTAESGIEVIFPSAGIEAYQWDVGNIETNVGRWMQERTERHRWLEAGLNFAQALERRRISQNIKLTLARMTKNFHMSNFSEEEPAGQSTVRTIVGPGRLSLDGTSTCPTGMSNTTTSKEVGWPQIVSPFNNTDGHSEERYDTPMISRPGSGVHDIVDKEPPSSRHPMSPIGEVQVQYPTTANQIAHVENYDSRAEAVAAICENMPRELSDFIIYDPAKHIFNVRPLESEPVSAAELKSIGLELVWLPLQSSSQYEIDLSWLDKQAREAVSSATTESSSSKVSIQSQTYTKEEVATSTDILVSESIGNDVADPEWTPSDEEYVLDVDSQVARSNLGSQYAGTPDSTSNKSRESLSHVEIERLLRDDKDIMYKIDDLEDVQETRTWPELAREFKNRHPELFHQERGLEIVTGSDTSTAYSFEAVNNGHLARLTRDNSSSSCAETVESRTNSTTPLAGGFQFTAYSNLMLEEAGKRDRSRSDSNPAEFAEATGPQDGVVLSTQHCNDTENASKLASAAAVPKVEPLNEKSRLKFARSPSAENFNMLEPLHLRSSESISMVTAEDLNIRFVGKTAHNSEFAKNSKVGALVDLFRSHGLISQQSFQPQVQGVTISPSNRWQKGYQSLKGRVSDTTDDTSAMTTNTGEKLTTARLSDGSSSSGLSDVDTVFDESSGENLTRVGKHEEED